MNRRTFLAASAATLVATGAARRASAQTEKKFKACVIGDTQNGGYGHSFHQAFALQPNVHLAAIADPDEEGRAKHTAESGAERSYADYQEMLEKEKPDLVAIGPRTTIRHKEYLLACADIGAHGFMEKPLCVDLAEADAMIEAIDAKNLKWAIAFNFRVSPLMDHLKKALTEDRIIGSLLELRGRGKEDNRAGGEDIVVLGVHLFDMMRFFAGDPRWCMSDITQNGKPATRADIREASEPLGPVVGNRLHAVYGFDTGIAGYFDSMKAREPGERWGLDLFGSTGIISIRQAVIPAISYLPDPTWSPGISGKQWQPLPGAPQLTINDEARDRHKFLVDDLIAAIEGDRRPAASLHDGRAAHEMAQGAFEAHFAGTRLPFPLANRAHPLIG